MPQLQLNKYIRAPFKSKGHFKRDNIYHSRFLNEYKTTNLKKANILITVLMSQWKAGLLFDDQYTFLRSM